MSEEIRVEMSAHHALEDATNRMRVLEGKDRYALQQEFLEWTACDDTDDIDLLWADYYQSWE